MTQYDGRLRLVGSTSLPLGVEIDLSGNRMTLSASGSEVADWKLDEIDISEESDGFHIEAEGEEVILNVADELRFSVELTRLAGQGRQP